MVVRAAEDALHAEYDSATPQFPIGYGTTGSSTESTMPRRASSLQRSQLAHPAVLDSPTAADLTSSFGAAAPGPTAPYYTGRYTPHTAVQYLIRITQRYIYQASLDIQHELAKDLLLDVGYIGTFGHKLPVRTMRPAAEYHQVPTPSLRLLQPIRRSRITAAFSQFANVQVLDPNIAARITTV